MNTQKSSQKWVTLLIVGLIFFSPGLLQGCDTFGVTDDSAPAPTQAETEKTKTKLRHESLMGNARAEKTVTIAGKKGEKQNVIQSTIHLVVGLSEYAASDITKRMISKYDVTRRLISKYGEDVNVKAELEESINAITIEINESILDELFQDFIEDPDVIWVEPDVRLQDPNIHGSGSEESSQVVPWGIAQVGALNASYSPGRVQVYILDSGITDSDEFNLASSVDFVTFYNARINAGLPSEKLPRGIYRDRLGHGTAVAGTIGARHNDQGIIGVAPGTALHNVTVLGKDGGTDQTTLLMAIEHVVQQKKAMPGYPFVVNLSLGANVGTTAYTAVDEAVVNAIDEGIVFVIAAGNAGINAATVSPAHVSEAITVGSYGLGRNYSGFSNYGPLVDLLAPGEEIVSLSNTYPVTGYLMASTGTSHAAPHVTGAVIRYLDKNPDATPAEVQQALKANATAIVSGSPSNTTNKSVFIQ